MADVLHGADTLGLGWPSHVGQDVALLDSCVPHPHLPGTCIRGVGVIHTQKVRTPTPTPTEVGSCLFTGPGGWSLSPSLGDSWSDLEIFSLGPEVTAPYRRYSGLVGRDTLFPPGLVLGPLIDHSSHCPRLLWALGIHLYHQT